MASAQIHGIQKYFGVTVGPDKPNGAASSYFSGIIREPVAGTQVCQQPSYSANAWRDRTAEESESA